MKSRLESIMEPRLAAAADTLGWTVHRQVRLERYTLDLLVETPAGVSLCIELDGAKWHERDEDAGLHDRRRDRFLLSSFGIATVRFLGKEILANPQACVTEIVQIASRLSRRRLDVIEDALATGQQIAKEHAAEVSSS